MRWSEILPADCARPAALAQLTPGVSRRRLRTTAPFVIVGRV